MRFSLINFSHAALTGVAGAEGKSEGHEAANQPAWPGQKEVAGASSAQRLLLVKGRPTLYASSHMFLALYIWTADFQSSASMK